MAKIGGKYERPETEKLLNEINNEDSITMRHSLISKYLHQRVKQVEKVIANIDDADIDLELVVEQLWEDLQLAQSQISTTIGRVDFYAEYNGIKKKHRPALR